MRSALVFFLAASAFAQERFVYPKPAPDRITVRRDIVFSGDLKFDLYRPAGTDVVPVVIFANVGSSAYTTWPFYTGWGETVAGAGLGGVVYQATTEGALPQFDALMTALRSRAAELHIDPQRVIVWSASSNVPIGLRIAMDTERQYIRGAVVEYGAAEVPEIRRDVPVLFVRAGLDTPQLNAMIDPMLARVLSANAPWTIINYGGGLHGFEMLNDNDVSRDVIDRELEFMKKVVRPDVTRAYAATADDATLGAAFARNEWNVAAQGYARRVATDPKDAESHRRLGLALMNTGKPAEALTHIERAWELGRRGPRDTGIPAAEAAAAAGNVERAVHWLELVLNTRFGPPIDEVRKSTKYERIRSDPRFEEMLQRVEAKRR
jgi:hypothetical protein